MRFSTACLAAIGASLPAVLSAPAASVTSACATYTPIPSPPASLHCGQSGTLKNPAPIAQSSPPKTLSACERACIVNSACLSFGFNAASKTCKLFSKTLNSQGFTQQSSAFVYYNEHCFACKTSPSTSTKPPKSTKTTTSSSSSSSTSSTCTPTATNLVENGSFETVGATTGPAGQSVAQSWGVSGSSSQGSGNYHLIAESGSYGYSGSKAEEFVGQLPSHSYPGEPILTLSQTLAGLTVGQTYTLAFAYDARAGAAICDLFVGFDGYSYSVPMAAADSTTYSKYSRAIAYKGTSDLLLFSTVCKASPAENDLRWNIDLDSVSVTGLTGC